MPRVTIKQIHAHNSDGVKYQVNVQFSPDKYNNKEGYTWTLWGAQRKAKNIIHRHNKKAFEPIVVKDYGIKSPQEVRKERKIV